MLQAYENFMLIGLKCGKTWYSYRRDWSFLGVIVAALVM